VVIPMVLKDGLRYRLLKQRLAGLPGDSRRIRYEIEDKIARTRYDGEWSLDEAEQLFDSLEPGGRSAPRPTDDEQEPMVDFVAVSASRVRADDASRRAN
jgi:hypothetical protein